MTSPEDNYRPPNAEPATALHPDTPEQLQNSVLEPNLEEVVPDNESIDKLFYEVSAVQNDERWNPFFGKTPQEVMSNDDLFAQYLLSWMGRLDLLTQGFESQFVDRQDIIQEAIIRAIKYDNRSNIMANPVNWLGTVARRISIDNYRKRQVRPQEDIFDYDIHSELPSQGTCVEDLFVAVEGATRVFKVLAAYDTNRSLRNDYRLVELFAEVCLRGVPLTEYARAQGIPVGTVKSRLHYGKKLVREEFEREAKKTRRLNIET